VIEGRNIICFASNWFYDPTSKHHVMRLLSERNHIIWVNYHASRRPRLSAADAGAIMRKLRQFADGPRRVTDNITVLTPLVAPLPGNRAVAALNGRLLARQIRHVLRGLPRRPVQMWSFAPDVAYMCGRFGEECVVYYCVDEFSGFSGYDAMKIRAAEARLARRADLVITTSQTLYDSKRDLNRNIVLVTHGVDHEHFAKATSPDVAVPGDIAALPRPILGFWGLIQDWLDVPLIAEIARARPAWSIVLIGETATDVSALRALPNVHLPGRRAYERLPAYAKGFDVGLIPFRINGLTRAVNPIKLREYLSAGLPVVSTALPEVSRYGELASIAGGAAEFVEACERILAADGADDEFMVQRTTGRRGSCRAAAARQAAMRSETWTAKVSEICEHVQHCITERRGCGADATR